MQVEVEEIVQMTVACAPGVPMMLELDERVRVPVAVSIVAGVNKRVTGIDGPPSANAPVEKLPGPMLIVPPAVDTADSAPASVALGVAVESPLLESDPVVATYIVA
jgi:hypothetical protein